MMAVLGVCATTAANGSAPQASAGELQLTVPSALRYDSSSGDIAWNVGQGGWAQKSTGVETDFPYWSKVRRDFGLEYDQPYLSAVAARSDTSESDLGVPITPAEARDIEGRDSLSAVAGVIHAAGIDSPAFGGVRIDQTVPGGAIEIRTAADAPLATQSSLISALKALVPTGVKVESSQTAFGAKEVDSVDGLLVDALAAGDLRGQKVVSIFTDTGPIRVTVAQDAPADAEQILRDKYPQPFVQVVRGAGVNFQSRDNSSGPVYGGEYIDSANNRLCTAGFSHALNDSGSGAYSTITAGHCDVPGTVWRQDSASSGGHIGSGTANNGVYNGASSSKCDCQSITVTPSSAATVKIYTSLSGTEALAALTSNDYAGFADGTRICMNGANYASHHSGGVLCGTINSQNGSDVWPTSGETITNLITAHMSSDSYDGDSGGTVYSGATFYGIHQAENSTPSEIFSRSTYIAMVTHAVPAFP